MLALRGWPHDTYCRLCLSAPETATHLCKDYPFTNAIWNRVQSWDDTDPRTPPIALPLSLIGGTTSLRTSPRRSSAASADDFYISSGMLGKRGTDVSLPENDSLTLRWRRSHVTTSCRGNVLSRHMRLPVAKKKAK
jgi:hypothetical protein